MIVPAAVRTGTVRARPPTGIPVRPVTGTVRAESRIDRSTGIVRVPTVIARRTVIARPLEIASLPMTLVHDETTIGRAVMTTARVGTLIDRRTAIARVGRAIGRPMATDRVRAATVPRMVIALVGKMIDRPTAIAPDVMVTGRTPTKMNRGDMVGMRASLIERAADVYWAGAARMTIKADRGVLN